MDNLGELETLDKLLKTDFDKLFREIKKTSGESTIYEMKGYTEAWEKHFKERELRLGKALMSIK